MSEVAQLTALLQGARADFLRLTRKVVDQANLLSSTYGTDDARFMFFQRYVTLNLWLLISLDTSIELMRDSTKATRYINMDSKTKVLYHFTHDQLTRQAYVTLAMFSVEDFIKNLMMGIQNPPKGKYFDFTKSLLKQLGINNSQKHAILNAPYQLRNALHNNGYPYHDFEVTMRGNHYAFEKGKRLNFTGWNHLYAFFDELINVLIEIVNNPRVKQVLSIPHTYIKRAD